MPKAISNSVRPQWNQNQFGGTFGGPIKKDRTFFFTSYEGRRVREGVPGKWSNVPARREMEISRAFGGFAGGGGN